MRPLLGQESMVEGLVHLTTLDLQVRTMNATSWVSVLRGTVSHDESISALYLHRGPSFNMFLSFNRSILSATYLPGYYSG
jgi:hypothetical protein